MSGTGDAVDDDMVEMAVMECAGSKTSWYAGFGLLRVASEARLPARSGYDITGRCRITLVTKHPRRLLRPQHHKDQSVECFKVPRLISQSSQKGNLFPTLCNAPPLPRARTCAQATPSSDMANDSNKQNTSYRNNNQTKLSRCKPVHVFLHRQSSDVAPILGLISAFRSAAFTSSRVHQFGKYGSTFTLLRPGPPQRSPRDPAKSIC